MQLEEEIHNQQAQLYKNKKNIDNKGIRLKIEKVKRER